MIVLRRAVLSVLLMAVVLTPLVWAESDDSDDIGAQFDALLADFVPNKTASDDMDESLLNDDAFTFEVDPSVNDEVKTVWIEALQSGGFPEEAAKQFAEQIGPANLQTIVDEMFPKAGFKANNVIDVQAIRTVIYLVIAQELSSTPDAGDLALRNGILANVSSEAILNGREISDADQQRQTQTLLLATLLIQIQYMHQKQSDASTDSYEQVATDTLIKTFGIDPRFQYLSAAGLDLKPEVTAVVRGEAQFTESFPDIDLASLGGDDDSPIARMLGRVFTELEGATEKP